MHREADSTIKGFMYQFNLSLKEILKSTDETIMLEGIVEDIDKISASENEKVAIQCKYHEMVDTFSWSKVYKPILQMLKTYSEVGSSNIKFVLYSFFPNETPGKKPVSRDVIDDMLKTQNEDYICNYISFIKKPKDKDILALVQKGKKSKNEKEKIVNYYKSTKLECVCDIDEFINNRFLFVIGKKYEELEKENIELLERRGFKRADITDIVYPNAIQKIAVLSMQQNSEQRKITREGLVEELQQLKKTAISRWTKELANYKELLKNRRKQLADSLNQNYRKRCLVFNPSEIENFDEQIVIFIKDFVDMYCKKVKLHTPATVCILGYDKQKIDILKGRLYQKDIEVETGYRGNIFFSEAFNQKPKIVEKNIEWMQFRLRICGGLEECIEAINMNKPDDIFQFTEKLPDKLSQQDVNIEVLDVQSFEEIEYLLKLRQEV